MPSGQPSPRLVSFVPATADHRDQLIGVTRPESSQPDMSDLRRHHRKSIPGGVRERILESRSPMMPLVGSYRFMQRLLDNLRMPLRMTAVTSWPTSPPVAA